MIFLLIMHEIMYEIIACDTDIYFKSESKTVDENRIT